MCLQNIKIALIFIKRKLYCAYKAFNQFLYHDSVAFDYGGVVTNSRREPEYSNKSKRPGNLKDMHW